MDNNAVIYRDLVHGAISPQYKVSNTGIIIGKNNKQMRSRIINGYSLVSLKKTDGTSTNQHVHRLVALTFIPNDDPAKITVNHKDGNKLNNVMENMEWMTQKQNIAHAAANNLINYHTNAVIKTELNGTLTRFESVEDAVKNLVVGGNVPNLANDDLNYETYRHNITRVCKGKGVTAFGFKWRYENPPAKVIKQNGLLINSANNEQFIDIPNYVGYCAARSGEICNKKTCKILKPMLNANGHHYVTLMILGEKNNKYINNLVADTFIPNPDNLRFVKHINGVKNDNRSINLQRY